MVKDHDSGEALGVPGDAGVDVRLTGEGERLVDPHAVDRFASQLDINEERGRGIDVVANWLRRRRLVELPVNDLYVLLLAESVQTPCGPSRMSAASIVPPSEPERFAGSSNRYVRGRPAWAITTQAVYGLRDRCPAALGTSC